MDTVIRTFAPDEAMGYQAIVWQSANVLAVSPTPDYR